MSSLHDRFNPRRNSLDLLRITLALAVAVAHGIVMKTGTQPSWGRSTVGDFAVDGFFILSGFLVTRSYLKLNSLPRYVWHRFLRIMPGFWVCLLVVAFVVAPLAAVLQGASIWTPFTESPSAFRFVLANAGLLITQYDIAGLLAGNPTPSVFDGSLWTLIYEGFCYFLLALAGVTGLLRRFPIVIPSLTLLVWLLAVVSEAGLNLVHGEQLLRMVFVFLLGACAQVYARRIPMNGWLAAVAAAVFVLSVATFDNYRLVGGVALAYALLWFSACFFRPVALRVDLSYGVYIYHWPMLQLLALTGLVGLSLGAFIAAGLVAAVAVAAASWFLVEHPALSHKNMAAPAAVVRAAETARSVSRRLTRSKISQPRQ